MRYEVIDRCRAGGQLTNEGTIARRASIDTSADVTIAEGATVSEDVLILTHDHGPDMRKHLSPLSIGERAWVGARAIILASCSSIGEGAVVGAGSVVTHDVPAGEVWAGNPARRIR